MQKKIDLGYGNPSFLQEISPCTDELRCLPQYMPYKLGKAILPELELAIKKVHQKYKNAKITQKTQVVITVGAIQALSAALYYYKKTKNTDAVYMPPPYWGRFDDLIAQQGMRCITQFRFDDSLTPQEQSDFIKQDQRPEWYETIALITSPNNPDGADTSKVRADIRDACYNWPHYTDNVVKFSDHIVIYSLSKATGYSSTRIGWALTDCSETASMMRKYVEIFTSGVSVEAQLHAAIVLERLASDEGRDKIALAKKVLRQRIAQVKKIIKESKLPIKVLSKQGMFLYIECSPQIIDKLGVLCFEGGSFSDSTESEECKRYRLNIGVSTKDFDGFADRLSGLKDIDYSKV